MNTLRAALRSGIKSFFKLLPSGAPDYIYRVLLRPRPLRALSNYFLVVLLPSSLQLPEGTLFLNAKDPVISGALALGVYEPYETELFRRALTPGMTVVDIGANIGYHTLTAAGRVGSEGRVIAFEPEPENYALLSRTIAENGSTQVTLSSSAIADKTGTFTLHLFDSNKGRHSLVPLAEGSKELAGTIEVPVETLDEALRSRAIQRVDVIKMDIEGAEALALKGMRETLSQPRLILFMEYSPVAAERAGTSAVQLLADLGNCGFTLYEIGEAKRTLVPINDFAAFSRRFSGEQYANLLCTKGVPPSVS